MTNKVSDFYITLKLENVEGQPVRANSVSDLKIKVFTSDINTFVEFSDITISDKEDRLYIDYDQLSDLKSGVICYTYSYKIDDTNFKDKYFNSTNINYTNFYLRQTTQVGKDADLSQNEILAICDRKLVEQYKELKTLIETSTPKIDLSQYAMKTELSNFLKAGDLSQYAKKEEIPIDKINSFLSKTILTDESMAIGINNSIDFFGRDSFAFGRDNDISGKGSYTIGERNRIEAGSFAFGIYNNSNYPNNVIIGKNNNISAQLSYTFGAYNKPQGNQSFVFGYGLSTTSEYEMALGRYNKSDGNTLFSIGNGLGTYSEKNAFSIDKDSKAYFVDIEDKSNKPQMICLQDKLPKDTVQLTFTLEDGSSQTLNVCTK